MGAEEKLFCFTFNVTPIPEAKLEYVQYTDLISREKEWGYFWGIRVERVDKLFDLIQQYEMELILETAKYGFSQYLLVL
jgi:hypothetical protein